VKRVWAAPRACSTGNLKDALGFKEEKVARLVGLGSQQVMRAVL